MSIDKPVVDLVPVDEHTKDLHKSNEELIAEVNERKRAEEALRASEEKYRTLIDKIQVAVIVHSPKTKILTSNRLAQALLGLSEDQLLGKTDFDPAWHFFREDETVLPREEYPVNRVLTTQRAIRDQVLKILRSNDSTSIWILLNADPVFDQNGELAEIIVTFSDITERKHTEEELKRSREQYFSLFSEMMHGFALHELICDDAGRPIDYITLEVNQAFEKLLGRKREDVVGKRVSTILPPEEVKKWVELFGNVTLTGIPTHYEMFSPVQDQVFHGFAFSVKKGQFAVLFEDITERKRAEEVRQRLSDQIENERAGMEQVLRQLPAGVIIAEAPSGKLVLGNEQMERIFRHPFIPSSAIEEYGEWKIYRPDGSSLEPDQYPIARSINSGEIVAGVELAIERGDGTVGSIHANSAPIRDRDGKIVAAVATFIDLTERKRVEEALKESEREYQEAQRVAHAGSWNWEIKTDTVNWTDELFRIAGRDPKDRAPDYFKDHPLLYTPESMARLDVCVQRALETGEPYQLDLEMVRPDGSTRWIDNSGEVKRDANGKIVGLRGAVHDITERKRAEEELKTASAYNRSLIEASLDPLVTIGPDGNITDVNVFTEKVTGYGRTELVGTDFSDYFTEPERARSIYQQVFREGFVRDYPLEIRHRDSHITPVLYNATVFRDESGQVKGVFAAARDITEQKQMEMEREQFFKFFQISSDIMVIADPNGAFYRVNPETLELLGYSEEELLSKPFVDFIHPDDKQSTLDEMARQIKIGSSLNFENRYLCKDGTTKWLSWKAKYDKTEDTTFATARDITEQRRTEEALRESERDLREAQRVAHAGSWSWDFETDTVTWSDELFRIAGRDPKEGAPGYYQGHPLIYTPVSMARLNACVEKALQTGEPYTLDLEMIRPDGSTRWIDNSGEVKRDAKGKIVGLRGALHDITERKLAEDELAKYREHLEELVDSRTAELQQAKLQAEEANRAKSAFLANMSHELRTPMNAILGFSSLMQNDPEVTATQRENLSIINRSGEHLLSLIDDVLDMARIESGRVDVELVAFDLSALLRDVIALMEMRSAQKDIELTMDLSSDVPRFVIADPIKLRQVLINLVGNAIKYTVSGGVVLRVSVKPNGVPRQLRLVIEVEDTGIGISEEDQSRIFEPFVQLGRAGTQKGTGLGLPITRQYVELMGGTIGVRSTPSQGSTFQVEMPVQLSTEAAVMNIESDKRQVLGLAPGQPEYRVLIVEDQTDNQMLLKILLEGAGFPVRIANNGLESIKIFESWRPHFIWMDRRMPVMDGLEATRRIRTLEDGEDTIIAATTASVFDEQREEMLQAGMDDFVRKPFRPEDIFNCMARHLNVAYSYREDSAPADEVAVPISAEMLASLPENLCKELADAIIRLNIVKIEETIERIAKQDSQLGRTLTSYATSYDYTAILEALGKYPGARK